jgi:DNA/RNA-binding domain of Phe-tRNA-synthetase-like protein
MDTLPFHVRHEIEGWTLFWGLLEIQPCDAEILSTLCGGIVERIKGQMQLDELSAHPTVAALRRLFRAAGCDPTRYRPSSEALLRRILKGEGLPTIHPLVDINNCLSATLAVPCCVMDEEALVPPFVFRSGKSGESYESLRGPFNLENKPLLLDHLGPCDAPITGSHRARISSQTKRAWLVAYLPARVVEPEAAERILRELLTAAPAARLLFAGESSSTL